jgi:hypothetical protein
MKMVLKWTLVEQTTLDKLIVLLGARQKGKLN